MRNHKKDTSVQLEEIFHSLIDDLQEKGVPITSADAFIQKNHLTDAQFEELFKVYVPTRSELALDEINRVFKKKNRIRSHQSRLSDYKNEACCKRKNRSTLNKEPIRDLRKLRKYFRNFLFLVFYLKNYSRDTINL